MSRRTVVIPDAVAKEIEKMARREKKSFSAMLSALAGEALRKRKTKYAWIGAGESGLPDLGANSEKYLQGEFVRE